MAPKAKTGPKKKLGKSPTKSNAANKDDLEGLDELLADEELMKQFEDKTVPPTRKSPDQPRPKPVSGAENARIGMEGFKAATGNPQMFAEAMSMLSDPNAVKEAQAMMQDAEFKREIQKHMASLKSDPAFQEAMLSAQAKFQDLIKDPTKLQELQSQYADIAAAAATTGDAAIEAKAPAEGAEEVADPGIDEATS